MTPPTDMSKLPVMSRKVTPMPRMMMYQLLVRMLMMFLGVKKLGTMMQARPKISD